MTQNPNPPETPHKPADDKEEIYYEGSPKLRAELFATAVNFLLGLALIVSPWFLKKYWTSMPWWMWLVCIAAGLVIGVWPILMVKTVRYRISNYRIDLERGLLSKRIDTLELWHVEDIQFYQSLLDRILQVGDITIVSHDDTTPKLVVRGVPNPRPLFETLKQRVIAVKRQRGVVKMDIGGGGDISQS